MQVTVPLDSEAEHPLDKAARLIGSRTQMAEKLQVSVAAIGNWKVRGVPFEKCTPIEGLTGKRVTRRDLRPDDWQKHWPELADSEPNTPPALTPPAKAAIEIVAIEGARYA